MGPMAQAASARPLMQAAQNLQNLADRHPPIREPRPGPRPLPLHLMTALSSWLSLPIVWPNLKNASSSSNPELSQRLKRVAETGQSPEFEHALAEAALLRSHAFLKGIKTYRHHPAKRNMPEAPLIWRAGSSKLRDYAPGALDAPVVLVVPSLINRFDILDLDYPQSFLRVLALEGMRPLVVDWDLPGEEEKEFALADYVMRLRAILDDVPAGRPVHLLGYCMGGLLALALSALDPLRVRTLTLMAVPWDFHQPDAAIGPAFLDLAAEMSPHLETLGHLPVDVIQSLFVSFQPLQTMQKFTQFAALDPQSSEARLFVLLEDWLNDGVPLVAQVARECLCDWYGENKTGKLQWRIGERVIDPRALAMPAYVVVPGKDRIVPPESARPLVKLLPHATLHEPMTGHIGLMASAKAPQQVWNPYLHWLKQHS